MGNSIEEQVKLILQRMKEVDLEARARHNENVKTLSAFKQEFTCALIDLAIVKETTKDIKTLIVNYYGKVVIDTSDHAPIIELLKYDKKNDFGNINFVLLEAIGKTKIDCLVDDALIFKAFEYYDM